MTARVCLDCGIPTFNGARCPTCARGRLGFAAGFRPGKRTATYDTSAWRKLSKRVREEWVRTHGWVCPGWRRDPHPSTDLTADHVVPLALGGPPLDRANVAVLCRSCQARKRLAQTPPGRSRR